LDYKKELANGIPRACHGTKDMHSRRWSKQFGIGVGTLSIIIGIAVMVYPGIGPAVAGMLMGISLLVASIQIFFFRITWKPRKRYTIIKQFLDFFFDFHQINN
jgi:uncharacterized membrane protein HdeD (DUF308 family)